VLASLLRVFRPVDRVLFPLWAATCTLASARSFYGYMLKQTGGEWSAPLDDVFIHFDYARATAQGHPFEWTVGNGYSSGNTSLTYPFVLAAGWLLGFTGRDLMKWAALVAMVSVFGTLLAARRLFVESRDDDWGRASSYLLPPIFLGVGAFVVQIVGVLTRPPGPPELRFGWLFAIAVGGAIFLFLLWFRGVRIAAVATLLLLAYDHQTPKMRDQKWFFGRASRNIRDQHLTLGKYLKELSPHRVLVGDAGAILYESERPGLDIIGLGGYGALPFARAGVHGLPATLELLERIPESDRPDVLAIFPTWWGVLPLWFASDVLRRFPVEGNVICGGYEHVVYKADWHLLDTGQFLRWTPPAPEHVRGEIDVADLVSERANGYEFDRPENGWADMRILPDPEDGRRDMFDGGRRIAVGRSEHFTLRGVAKGMRGHLVVRTAQEKDTRVRVRVDGVDVGILDLVRTGGWNETPFEVPADVMGPSRRVSLTNEGPGDFVDFHVWITQ